MALIEVLAALVPIGIYCILLTSINRRATPLLVSGSWDAIGLLFAGSGFLLVTVPMLFTEFYTRILNESAKETFFAIWLRHMLVWIAYYVVLVGCCACMVIWRGHKTMIYNVEPALVRPIFDAVLTSLGLEVSMRKQRLAIAPARTTTPSTAFSEAIQAPAAMVAATGHAEVDIDIFPALCHVTLHWNHYTPELRRDIEQELRKGLEHAVPVDNPAAGWFLSVSGMIFGMIFMALATMLFLLILQRR